MTFDRNLWHIRIRATMCEVIAQIDVANLLLQYTYVCMCFSEALGVNVWSYVCALRHEVRMSGLIHNFGSRTLLSL